LKDHKYDSDSYLLGINNHASASMTNSEYDFIITPTPIDLKITEIKGYLNSTKIGMVRWNIQDDEGCTLPFDIPGTYIVKELLLRLFSPQYVAKKMIKKDTYTKGLTCVTYADKVLLKWKQYTRTIPLGSNNVPILRSELDFNNYHSQSIPEIWTPKVLQAFSVEIEPTIDMLQDMEDISQTPIDNSSSESETTTSQCKPEELLMAWKIKLAHIPFKTNQQMSTIGHLPKSLAQQKSPKCQAYMYGKATRIPWRVKRSQRGIKSTTQPGECISVDQMEPSCPVLNAQLKGIPTLQRYKHVTVFVDHYTRYTYVYMQQSTSSKETLMAKK
jgi:hypothetical protein